MSHVEGRRNSPRFPPLFAWDSSSPEKVYVTFNDLTAGVELTLSAAEQLALFILDRRARIGGRRPAARWAHAH